MGDHVDTSSEPKSSRHERPSDDGARSQLLALARALGRQAARQLWVDTLRGDAAIASAEIPEPKQACLNSGPRRAAR